jgi:hypothetical protein
MWQLVPHWVSQGNWKHLVFSLLLSIKLLVHGAWRQVMESLTLAEWTYFSLFILEGTFSLNIEVPIISSFSCPRSQLEDRKTQVNGRIRLTHQCCMSAGFKWEALATGTPEEFLQGWEVLGMLIHAYQHPDSSPAPWDSLPDWILSFLPC